MQRFQSSFFIHSTAALTIILISFIATTNGDECIDVSNPQTRSFATLLNLQANKESFKPNVSNFAGNYITIQENIESLGRNSFICYTSKYIIKIFLRNLNIKQIQEGAFVSLDCLTTLDMHQNAIDSLTRETFLGLPLLQELNLGENKLKEIPELVFSFLPRLKILNLAKNSVKLLHRDSFYNLGMLEQLDLSYNHLHQFVPDVMKHFRQLKNLQLGSNQIYRMEFEKWDLLKLTILNLSSNVLVSFDTSYDFNYGATLKELYLDSNLLTQINPYGLRKHFPNLTVIDINNNPWTCLHLTPLITSLNDTRVKFRGLSSDGGPNIDGIACNRSMEIYTKDKQFNSDEDVTKSPDLKSTTSAPKRSLEIEVALEKILISNAQILQSVRKMNTMIAALFAIVIIFIFIDVIVRSGVINRIKTCGNGVSGHNGRNISINTNENIENDCLLRER